MKIVLQKYHDQYKLNFIRYQFIMQCSCHCFACLTGRCMKKILQLFLKKQIQCGYLTQLCVLENLKVLQVYPCTLSPPSSSPHNFHMGIYYLSFISVCLVWLRCFKSNIQGTYELRQILVQNGMYCSAFTVRRFYILIWLILSSNFSQFVDEYYIYIKLGVFWQMERYQDQCILYLIGQVKTNING